MRQLLLALLLMLASPQAGMAGTVCPDTVDGGRSHGFFRGVGNFFTRIFRGFNEVDTNYIEPQHYNYTAMLQNTNTYEEYTLRSKSGQSVSFAPRPTVKAGPYIGWRWLFLGYTFGLGNRGGGENKKEFDLSIYSSLLGIDLYYRRSGDNYRIMSTNIMGDKNSARFRKIPFGGISSSIKGFDLYYIFNHRKFSYPAAFSQSTCQKRSCGSPLLGVGYTTHSISLDHEKLQQTIASYASDKLGMEEEVKIDSGLMFRSVKYSSFSVSGGYAYNWVFARNCLLSASASLAVAYKESEADRTDGQTGIKAFSFKNFNFDGIGRFGAVWNNRKWFVGASLVLHSYSYRKSLFSTSSYFGSLNIYAGMNFGKKRNYRK